MVKETFKRVYLGLTVSEGESDLHGSRQVGTVWLSAHKRQRMEYHVLKPQNPLPVTQLPQKGHT